MGVIMKQKSKVDYKVYVKWYKKYAKTVEMRDALMPKGQFMLIYKDAKRSGQNMRDFSRTIAMRQRQASELQTRVTWGAYKEVLKETKKNIREYRKEKQDEFLEDSIQLTRKQQGLPELSKKELAKEVGRIKKKGIPQFIKDKAKERLDEDMQAELTFVKNFEGLTWKEFKKNQKEMVTAARELTDSREVWDEAFKEAFTMIYRK